MSAPHTDSQPPAAAPGKPDGPAPARQKNVLGLIALIVAAVGFVFACIPGALIVGWTLLPIGFILGIVGVALPRRKKGASITAIIVSVVGTIVGVLVFVMVVAGAVDDAFKDAGLTVDEGAGAQADAADAGSGGTADAGSGGTDAGAAKDADLDAKAGTRDNPLTIGQKAGNKNWTVTLGTPHEATDAVLDENQFNEPPKDGLEDWIVPVKATYTGDDTGNPIAISVGFVSADGHTYDGLNAHCGVIPDPLDMAGEVYAGATAEGNTCLQVPAGADGVWKVTAGLFSDPVFFAAK